MGDNVFLFLPGFPKTRKYGTGSSPNQYEHLSQIGSIPHSVKVLHRVSETEPSLRDAWGTIGGIFIYSLIYKRIYYAGSETAHPVSRDDSLIAYFPDGSETIVTGHSI